MNRNAAHGHCRRLGLIAEELPQELVHAEGKGVGVYSLTTALLAAVMDLKTKVEWQGETIRQLREQAKELQNRRQAGSNEKYEVLGLEGRTAGRPVASVRPF